MSADEPSIQLNRMEVEEVGTNPERLAGAIHKQLGLAIGPVPVFAIARALDIVEIREENLTGVEGALVTTPQRPRGSIVINRLSPIERRRFTLSHELGHFLNQFHRSSVESGFQCSQRDMTVSGGDGWHLKQEAEANRFAIELLAPQSLIRRYLATAPDLTQVVAMAGDLEISKEASARRYVEKHRENLAAVFSKDGRVKYTAPGKNFPALDLQPKTPLPVYLDKSGQGDVTDFDPVDASEWLRKSKGFSLLAQTLVQRDGHAITLLQADENEDDGEIDTFDRFNPD